MYLLVLNLPVQQLELHQVQVDRVGVGRQVDDLPDFGLAFLRQLGEVVAASWSSGEARDGLHHIHAVIVVDAGDALAAPLGVVDQDLQRAAGVGGQCAGHRVDGR